MILKRISILYFFQFFFFGLFRAAPAAYEGSQARSRILMEVWPLAYTTATATPDTRHVCNLHHISCQCWILNSLSEAGDRTYILMDASQIHSTEPNGNSSFSKFFFVSMQ